MEINSTNTTYCGFYFDKCKTQNIQGHAEGDVENLLTNFTFPSHQCQRFNLDLMLLLSEDYALRDYVHCDIVLRSDTEVGGSNPLCDGGGARSLDLALR